MSASYASTSVGKDSSNAYPSMENDQIIGTAKEFASNRFTIGCRSGETRPSAVPFGSYG
jgi:hypothetical protein